MMVTGKIFAFLWNEIFSSQHEDYFSFLKIIFPVFTVAHFPAFKKVQFYTDCHMRHFWWDESEKRDFFAISLTQILLGMRTYVCGKSVRFRKEKERENNYCVVRMEWKYKDMKRKSENELSDTKPCQQLVINSIVLWYHCHIVNTPHWHLLTQFYAYTFI